MEGWRQTSGQRGRKGPCTSLPPSFPPLSLSPPTAASPGRLGSLIRPSPSHRCITTRLSCAAPQLTVQPCPRHPCRLAVTDAPSFLQHEEDHGMGSAVMGTVSCHAPHRRPPPSLPSSPLLSSPAVTRSVCSDYCSLLTAEAREASGVRIAPLLSTQLLTQPATVHSSQLTARAASPAVWQHHLPQTRSETAVSATCSDHCCSPPQPWRRAIPPRLIRAQPPPPPPSPSPPHLHHPHVTQTPPTATPPSTPPNSYPLSNASSAPSPPSPSPTTTPLSLLSIQAAAARGAADPHPQPRHAPAPGPGLAARQRPAPPLLPPPPVPPLHLLPPVSLPPLPHLRPLHHHARPSSHSFHTKPFGWDQETVLPRPHLPPAPLTPPPSSPPAWPTSAPPAGAPPPTPASGPPPLCRALHLRRPTQGGGRPGPARTRR